MNSFDIFVAVVEMPICDSLFYYNAVDTQWKGSEIARDT